MVTDLEKKIEELKIVEQSLQTILAQKQVIQTQLSEIENAINEIEKISNGQEIYKMIGNILIPVKKEDILKELKERKEVLDIRLQSLNKQEERLKEKLQKLQQEIMQKYQTSS